MKGKTVIVWGDIILDRYLWGSVNRISPEAPVPVVNVNKTTEALGGAANVARNLKALGVKPILVGLCGKDSDSASVKKLLSENGIEVDNIITDKARPTTVKTRIVAHGQQVVRFDNEKTTDVSGALSGEVASALKKLMKKASGIVVSDYCKGCVTPMLLKEIISASRANGLFVSVDPKIKHASSYEGASLITPNRKEAEELTGIRIDNEDDVKKAGWKLQKELNLDASLITMSEEGMALFEKSGVYSKIPTMASEVFDVTGAGDTVISAFTAFSAGGATLKEAAYLSNCAAGIVIREMGTAVTDTKQIAAELW
jgi:D-beta-D-heptose 7-phosphate kinase/D-beta-D-heptose 1-phosphate adenosyltransferase